LTFARPFTLGGARRGRGKEEKEEEGGGAFRRFLISDINPCPEALNQIIPNVEGE